MNKPFENVGGIIIYQTEDGQTQVDVHINQLVRNLHKFKLSEFSTGLTRR